LDCGQFLADKPASANDRLPTQVGGTQVGGFFGVKMRQAAAAVASFGSPKDAAACRSEPRWQRATRFQVSSSPQRQRAATVNI